MKELMAVCITGICVLGVYRVFELFARRKERLNLVDKLNSSTNLDTLKDNCSKPFFKLSLSKNLFWSLRISLLMLGVGLGWDSSSHL